MEWIKLDEHPFISIVIPAKNEEKNIGRCLSGIQALDYPKDKIEIIVVDNGSSDKTVRIAERMGAVVYIIPDVSIAALRNYGYSKSQGEYIAYLDADCIPNKEWLKIAVYTFYSLNDVDVVGGIIELERKVHKYWVEEYWLQSLNAKYIKDINYVNTIASFCFVIKANTMN